MSNGAVAGFARPKLQAAERPGWFDQFAALLAREFAPSSRKLRTALRMTTIATVGAALVVICHVSNELGTYVVWLLAGAGPMMSVRRAGAFLILEAAALASSVVMARALAETPWLMLPFLFVVFSSTTYVGTTRKLGAAILLIEVVSLDTFYGVVFAPQEIGWGAAGAFGGSVIAFGVTVLFDNWLWPDPGEPLLMMSLGTSVAHARSRLLAASDFFLDRPGATRPPLPPATSDLPAHMALLDQVMAEGASEHRHAILLAAITRVARISLEVDRLILATRVDASREIRSRLGPETLAAVNAIAAALDDIAKELPTHVAVGVDQTPPASRTRARLAMDALNARVTEMRPQFIGSASLEEIENFASFNDALAAVTDHIERLLDEPPQPRVALPPNRSVPRLTDSPNPALVRHALKVGLCVVAGYLVGIFTQRADLSTILTTVLITALPTYGAALRKMILRIIGGILGGAVSLLAIIIVTPNFETLPAYLLVTFVVFYVSAYSSLGSGRVAYAGKQIGTTFALVFAGLRPSIEIYEPLWRIWAILLGTLVVAVVAFLLWPEYAGDSLLPRLRKVIRDTLALAPGGSATNTEDEIQQVNSGTMRTLAEILEIAADAQVEGRSSTVNHNAIVEAAGTLRRVANRLASIATARIVSPTPRLDPPTESARDAMFEVIRRQLQSWLDFFSSSESLNARAAQATARSHSPDDLETLLLQFTSRLGEQEYSRIASWTVEQRRAILADQQSMRRLEFLLTQLDRWLPQIPGGAPAPGS